MVGKIEKACMCVEKILELADAVEKLNLSLQGVNVIGDRFKEAESACEPIDLDIQRRIVNYGIADFNEGEIDIARNEFDTAKKQILAEGLLSIRGNLCKK